MQCKKIVITGASGFLGSHLVETIKDDEKFQVYALSSHPDDLRKKFGESNAIYLHKDNIFRDTDVLNEAFVVNCAYPRNSAGRDIADGLKYIQKVFSIAVDNRATAIINISSQSVYSQQRTEAATEETEICLESSYAVGKYATELMLECTCRGGNTRYTNLRMGSLIGPGFDQRVVNRLINNAMQTGTIEVADNRQKYGYFDIGDAARAICCTLNTNPHIWRSTYNIGNNEASYSLKEIAESIKEVFKEKELGDIIIQTKEDRRYGCSAINSNLFMSTFGFNTEISLKQSIVRIIENR